MREELFTSDTRKPAAVDVAAFRRFAFVIDGEVVVSMRPDEGWATGPAKVEKNRADRFLIRARRPVDPKKLPPEVAELAGSPVRLMDDRGVRCDGHVELLFNGFSDYRSANALGQPQFLEHGVVRALGDSYIEIEGPETPILICPC